MKILDVSAVLITAAALLSYVNHRFVKLPSVIGLMLIAMLISGAIILIGEMGFVEFEKHAEAFIASIDFNVTLMNGMLSFLLFAGALHVNLNDLANLKWVVGLLASVGTLLSTFLVGGAFWLLCHALDIELAFIYCLLFGALISPTDPIAVLGILKSAGAPKSLETKITGESLFNDGVGVVVFMVLLGLATSEASFSAGAALGLFAQEAVGGIVMGLLLGCAGYYLLRTVDNYSVEVLITLALVMGGYSLTLAIHASGPIAMVVAGLMIGNHGRRMAMSETTREHLDTFWELIDEILNAVLFVLIGFEVLILTFTGTLTVAGLIAIPLVLAARFVCVGIPILTLRTRRVFAPGTLRVLTWGGLRGGISIALVLSIPAGPERDTLLPVTYMVVAFSILVQGLTIGPLVRKVVRDTPQSE